MTTRILYYIILTLLLFSLLLLSLTASYLNRNTSGLEKGMMLALVVKTGAYLVTRTHFTPKGDTEKMKIQKLISHTRANNMPGCPLHIKYEVIQTR